ncbi:tandem-95 repeat protein [Enterovibrio makurazakiensis]|uniref:Ig-like domain-containing protein n=1 Tax=Enterovibrio makurazakiensis TaxID=2910232 RepID=UPI003D24FB5F
MSEVKLPFGANVLFVSGAASLNQLSTKVEVGKHLNKGQILNVESDTIIAFQDDNGRPFIYSNSDIHTLSDVLSSVNSLNVGDQDIAQIIESIISGQDPTQTDENSTASGMTVTSTGTHGFYALSRDANETIASAGYDTKAYDGDETAANTQEQQTSNFFVKPELDVSVDALTKDSTPTITGTTNQPSGSSVQITITDADGNIQTITAIVQASGSFFVDVPQGLTDGQFSITASLVDSQGSRVVASASGIIDTTAPGEGTGSGGTDELPLIAIPEAIGGVGETEVSDGIEVQVTPPTGTKPGDIITLTVTQPDGDTTTVTATVPNGWISGSSVPIIVSPEALGGGRRRLPDEGDYTITATVTDSAGNTSAPSVNADFSIDTTAPGEGTGVGGTDELPLVAIPEASGGVGENEVSDGIEVQVTPPTGTEPGDKITVTVTQPDGDTTAVTATVPNGWTGGTSVSVTVSPEDLGASSGQLPDEGDYTIIATVTDSAGNTSASSTDSDFTIDTTAPGEGTGVGGTDELPLVAIPESTGGIGEAEVSDGVEVQITPPTGTEPGDTVTVTVTQPDGNITSVTATVPNGWTSGNSVSVNVSPEDLGASSGQLPDEGDYTISATVTDSAGNTSASSTDSDFTIDTTAPGEGTGVGGTDELPLVAIPEASGGVGENEVSNGIDVQVTPPTGTKPGDTITVTVTQPDGDMTQVIATVPNGWAGGSSVSVTVSPEDLGATSGQLPDEGDYTITATVTDSAGNTSASSTDSDFTVDTTAPGEGTGVGGTDELPLVAIPEASGGVGENDVSNGIDVQVTPPTGTKPGDTITLTVTQPDGDTTAVTATVPNGWTGGDSVSITVSPEDLGATSGQLPDEGDYTITTTVTDSAGNTSASSSSFDITVDTTSSATPTVTITDDANNDGLVNSQEHGSDDVQLTVSVDHGDFSTGGLVTVVVNNDGVVRTENLKLVSGSLQHEDGSSAADYSYNNGTISWNEVVAAGDSISVNATQTDSAGNVSSSGTDSALATQASNDASSTQEDVALNGNVLTNDLGNSSVTSFLVTGSSTVYTAGQTAVISGMGSFALNANGSYSFTPETDWNGTVPDVTYTTNSGDTATVGITVTAVDDAVDAVDDTYSMNEDDTLVLNLLGNDQAPDDGLEITHINGIALTGRAENIAVSNGTVVIDADGSMSFKPDANYFGSVSFNYQVKDSDGSSDTASVNITVNSVNDGPDAVDDTLTMTDAGAIASGYTGNAIDTQIIEGYGTGKVDDSAYMTTTHADGSYTVVFRAWDTNYYGNNKVVLQSFNADGSLKGDKLTLGSRDKIESPQVTQLNDDGDLLVTWTGYNNSATLNTHSYAQVVYANPDDHGGATTGPEMDLGSSQLRTVTSEHSGDTSIMVWQNSFTLYMQELDVSGNKVGGAQVVGSVSANSNGYPIESKAEISVLDNGNYVISWNQGSTATATNTVMLSPDGDKIGSQQTLNIGGTDGIGDLETNVVSIGDGKYAIVGSSGGVVKLTLVDGTTNQPITNSTQTLSLAGTTSNDLPSITNVGADGDFVVVWRGIEGGEWQTYIQHFDADGSKDQPVSKLDAPGGHGPAKVIGVGDDGDYVIVWSSINDAGDYDVHTQKYNADGTKDGDQLTFTGQQENKNDLNFDIVAVGDEGAYTISFLGTDSSANGGDYSIYIASVDANGNKVVAYPDGSTGDFSITTDVVISSGFYSVSYSTGTLYANGTAYPSGSQVPANEWVNVTLVGAVAADYDLVVTAAEAITTDEDTALVINVSDLLLNDTDLEGDTLTVVSVQAPENGTVTLNGDGTITFTPTADYSGPASFTYTISDGQGGTDTATVNLSVLDTTAPATGDGENTISFLDGGNERVSDSESTNVPLSGKVAVGSTVNSITITDGTDTITVDTGDITVAGDGTVSVTGQDLSSLADGTLTVTMNVSDSAGNNGNITDTTVMNIAGREAFSWSLLSDPDGDGTAIDGGDSLAGYTSESINTGTVDVTFSNDGRFGTSPSGNIAGAATFQKSTPIIAGIDGGSETINTASSLRTGYPDTSTGSTSTVNFSSEVTNVQFRVSDLDVYDTVRILAFDADGNPVEVTFNAGSLLTVSDSDGVNGNDTVTGPGAGGNHDGTDPNVSALINIAGPVSSLQIIHLDGPGAVVSDIFFDSPVIKTVNDSASTQEDVALSGNVLDNDSGDISVATFSVTGSPTVYTAGQTATISGVGTFELGTNGGYNFTPEADWSGVVPTITYTTNSGDSATINLMVTPEFIDAVDDSYTLSNGGNVALDLLSNDTATGSEITQINGVALTGNAQNIAVDNGSVVIAGDGSMSFVPDSNFYGQIDFDYQVQSDNGDSDTATVTIAGDANKPTLSVVNTNTDNEVGESFWATFTISLSDAVTEPTKVKVSLLLGVGYDVSNEDLGKYEYWTGSTWANFKNGSELTLSAFQTELNVRTQPINDSKAESAETLIVRAEPIASETNIQSGQAEDTVVIVESYDIDTSGLNSGFVHWHIDADGVQHVMGNRWHPNEKVTLNGPDGSEKVVYADSDGFFHESGVDYYTSAGTLSAQGESSGNSKNNIEITPSITPIVLDLDGDGIETSDVTENPVNFDYDGDGQAVNTGWVSGGDGLLVRDINKDGEINDGSELFGSNTELQDGTNAADGYEALAQHDTNADGIIDQNDTIYSELGVWVDTNMDGKTDEGELLSLEEAGVASISLDAQTTDDTQNNNTIGKTSTYTTTDGEERAAADVWFATQQTGEEETNIAGLVEEHSISGLDNSELVWNSDNVDDQPWSDTVTDFTVGESHLDLSDLVTDHEDNLLSEADVDMFEQDGSLVFRVDTDGDHAWNQEIILQDVSLQDIVDENGMIKNGVFGDDNTKELFQKAAATDVVENTPTLLDDPTVDHH